MITQKVDGHSSKVAIFLYVDGARLNVAQVGLKSMILRETRVVQPATAAILSISVDGEVEEKAIVLPHGIDGTSLEVDYI